MRVLTEDLNTHRARGRSPITSYLYLIEGSAMQVHEAVMSRVERPLAHIGRKLLQWDDEMRTAR